MGHDGKVDRRSVVGFVLGNDNAYIDRVYKGAAMAERGLKEANAPRPGGGAAGYRVLGKLRNGNVCELDQIARREKKKEAQK